MARIRSMALAAVFMVAIVVVTANQCSSGSECPSGGETNIVVSLLQSKMKIHVPEDDHDEEIAVAKREAADRDAVVKGSLVKAATGGEACTHLLNKNTHFAVKVSVGTPAQSLELVLDTGSNAVMVTPCVFLSKDGFVGVFTQPCYKGHDKSSSFAMTTQHHGEVVELSTDFGSGNVISAVASDIVDVGGIKAAMKDGLLLIVDQGGLNFSDRLEGILGLGPPDATTMEPGDSQQVGSDQSDDDVQVQTKNFLKEAGVERFTICFNDGLEPGVLRMNGPKFQNTLPSSGTTHWSLGLYGVSVGSETAPAILCDSSDVKDGRRSACGAIPDSGTTLLTAPKDQVLKLFASLCEDWDRCRGARRGSLKNETAANAFQLLVHQCKEWMTDEKGIDEIPSIFFTVGSPSNQQKIEVTPWAYIVETESDQYEQHIEHLKDVIPVLVKQPAGGDKVCVPRIGGLDFMTDENGPVWMLGTPLFYQYTVGYDAQGPGISFKNGACTKCAAPVSLLESHKELGQRARPLRAATELPRVRKIHKSLPL